MAEKQVGTNMPLGTVAEGQAMVGKRSRTRFHTMDVNWPMIKIYASAMEDGNPCYWDVDYARRRFGDIVSPPGMLMVWGMGLDWQPDAPVVTDDPPLMNIPLPGTTIINVVTETEFFRPIRVGERLNAQEELVSVSDEKSTKLGVGCFIRTQTSYRNQAGELVAIHTNDVYRYRPHDKEVTP